MTQSSTAIGTSSRNEYDAAQLKQLIQDMLAQAQQRGASAAEAGLNVETGLSVTVRMGEVETIEHNRDKGVGITVYFGQRKGNASTTDFSAAAIKETVEAACNIARYTQDDKYAGLPDAERLAKDIPDLDLYHPWAISAEDAVDICQRAEAKALHYDERIINSEGAYISSHSGTRVYGNSLGFIHDCPTSRHSIGCTVIGKDAQGMQRDYWYSLSRVPTELEDPAEIGLHAAQRVIKRLDHKRVKTQQLPVIFQAEVARGLLGHFVRAVSGGALYRKASFLLDKLGEQIFPQHIRIDERPHIPRSIGSAPYDNEGVATQARELVSDGNLQGYVLDSYAARRLGMQTTGNAGGVHNLYISDSGKNLEQLVTEMDRGILVTEVMGQGVNIVTGDYSRGAAGFWVENGEIQYPVEEFTLAGNLANMFQQLVAVANDTDTRGSLCSGSWLIENMTIAGE